MSDTYSAVLAAAQIVYGGRVPSNSELADLFRMSASLVSPDVLKSQILLVTDPEQRLSIADAIQVRSHHLTMIFARRLFNRPSSPVVFRPWTWNQTLPSLRSLSCSPSLRRHISPILPLTSLNRRE
jgi:hypothetical protein